MPTGVQVRKDQPASVTFLNPAAETEGLMMPPFSMPVIGPMPWMGPVLPMAAVMPAGPAPAVSAKCGFTAAAGSRTVSPAIGPASGFDLQKQSRLNRRTGCFGKQRIGKCSIAEHRTRPRRGRWFIGLCTAGQQSDRQGNQHSSCVSEIGFRDRLYLQHAKLSLEEFRPHLANIGLPRGNFAQLGSTLLSVRSRSGSSPVEHWQLVTFDRRRKQGITSPKSGRPRCWKNGDQLPDHQADHAQLPSIRLFNHHIFVYYQYFIIFLIIHISFHSEVD
jgi:hypothetical protein